MIRITHKGDLAKTLKFLLRMRRGEMYQRLDSLCQKGVEALSAATPVETGKTAASWSYEIKMRGGNVEVVWSNSNIVNGYCVAMLLQYGHGTRGKTYVRGLDYINPAMRPIFENIADGVWREVTRE